MTLSASSTVYSVHSFSVVTFSIQNFRRLSIIDHHKGSNHRTRRLLFEEYMSEDYTPPNFQKHNALDEHEISNSYGLGGVDLQSRWIELVSGGHITAITELKDDVNDKRLSVRYGVKINDQSDNPQQLLEFVEVLSDQDDEDCMLRKRIMIINATLSEMQSQVTSSKSGGMALECLYDGPYAIQLQLLRTLRPPRSNEMSKNQSKNNEDDYETPDSCVPPLYDATKDSFLVGQLRLYGEAGIFHGDGEPRENAAQVVVPRTSKEEGKGSSDDDSNDKTNGIPWDIYHNISPVDPMGHFLLLPDMSDQLQWRDQSLNSEDCCDLTYLASTIEPRGSMILCFNSVSAGASQNHIHAHAWPNPPPPLLHRNDPTAEYDSVYAVVKASSLASFNIASGLVKVSLLKYACTCVKLSAKLEEQGTNENILLEMGTALSKIVSIAQKMEIPHNVVWTNDKASNSVETYVFFRKSETVLVNDNPFRLGASECMGVFHTSSRDELFAVKKHRGLSCYGSVNVLSDVSYEPNQNVWAEVTACFAKTNRRLAALQRAELHKKKCQ